MSILRRVIGMMGQQRVYATWDPVASGTGYTLSGGNLTATYASGGSAQFVISTIGKTSGKWYWEYTVGTLGTGFFSGISLGSAFINPQTQALFLNISGWTYIGSNGNKESNGSSVAYGAAYSAGDVIGVYLDVGGGTVGFLKNNVDQGVAYTGLSGAIYAAHEPYVAAVTANFGATALTYSPPSGYNAGLYL